MELVNILLLQETSLDVSNGSPNLSQVSEI